MQVDSRSSSDRRYTLGYTPGQLFSVFARSAATVTVGSSIRPAGRGDTGSMPGRRGRRRVRDRCGQADVAAVQAGKARVALDHDHRLALVGLTARSGFTSAGGGNSSGDSVGQLVLGMTLQFDQVSVQVVDQLAQIELEPLVVPREKAARDRSCRLILGR